MNAHVIRPKRKDPKTGLTKTSPYYVGRYRIPGEAKKLQVPLKTKDKTVANAALLEIVRDEERVRAGFLPPKTVRDGIKEPLGALIDQMWDEKLAIKRDGKYCGGRKGQLRTLLRECGWNTARDVTADSFQQWRMRKSLVPKTLNDYLSAASAFMDWLVRGHRILHNPLKSVQPMRNRKDPVYERFALSDEQATRLIATSGERSVLYWIPLETGLRRKELTLLEWRDVALTGTEPFIRVRKSTAKNGNLDQQPLTPALAEALRQRRTSSASPMERVFPKGVPEMEEVRKDFDRAGIPAVNDKGQHADFHSLRHTFCTRLAVRGVPLVTAMKLMRHSDPKLTSKVYTDAGRLPTREALLSLPSLVASVGLNSPQNSPVSGSGGLLPSPDGANGADGVASQQAPVEDSGRSPSPPGAAGREAPPGGPGRNRTCVKTLIIEGVTKHDAPGNAPDSGSFAELAEIVTAWPRLAHAVRAGIVAIVRSGGTARENGTGPASHAGFRPAKTDKQPSAERGSGVKEAPIPPFFGALDANSKQRSHRRKNGGLDALTPDPRSATRGPRKAKQDGRCGR